MTTYLLAALLALQAPAARPAPDTAPAGAYLDAGARELVRLARQRRSTADRSIRRYQVLATERISIGLRALGRERLFYRRETAARIDWTRDGPIQLKVLGARETVPVWSPKVRLPDDIDEFAPDLAFNAADPNLLPFGGRSPLAANAEANYRFASGDTTTLRLPDGRTLRLVELRVLPRRLEPTLITGSFWIETDTYAVVRTAYRPAAALDPGDVGRSDVDSLSSDVRLRGSIRIGERKPDSTRLSPAGRDSARAAGRAETERRSSGPVRHTVRYVSVDYGLWDMRWWLPRVVAVEGTMEVAGRLAVSSRFERSYDDYQVAGDPEGAPAVSPPVAAAPDSAPPGCRGWRCRHTFHVEVPSDTAALIGAAELPESIYEETETLTGQDVDELARQMKDLIPGIGGLLLAPDVHWSIARGDLLRYNRVEGLSVGVRATADFGALSLDATARLGSADWTPSAEVGVARETFSRRLRAAAYHRLAGVDPAVRPFSLTRSLDALVLGRDDGDYFRATGLEITGAPPSAAEPRWSWRIYAERQRPVAAATDFSLRRLADDDHTFRPNIEADTADQLGGWLTLRRWRGLDPDAPRWHGELSLEAAAGSYRYLRPSALARLGAPLPGPFAGSLEVAGAYTLGGEVPVQSFHYLGGSATVRGYDVGSARGEAFWRARAELGLGPPGRRLALFGDAGWAGDRRAFTLEPALVSAGAGVSLLDGLFRMDLARALRGTTGWKLHLYLNAAL